MGQRWANRTNPLAIMSKHAHRPKVPSPTNAANFPSEGSLVDKTTSLDTRTTTSSTSASSALVHFLPLLLLQRSTTVHTLMGALNLTTRQDTTAECPAHSTPLFVTLSLDSRQKPRQILTWRPPSVICSYKTLMPSSTTTMSPTPFLPAKMASTSPSCSQETKLTWQEYLHGSPFY